MGWEGVQLWGGGCLHGTRQRVCLCEYNGCAEGFHEGPQHIVFSGQELGLGFVEIVHFQDNSHTFEILSSTHFSFNGFFMRRTRYICLNVGQLQCYLFYS